MHDTLMLLGFEVVVVVSVEFYPCTGNGLSARGTNHYIAVPVIGQLLYHHSQVAHIEESSGWRHTWVVGRHLHEIGAYGQRRQQDGIFHLLVVWMTIKLSAVFFLVQLRSLGFQPLVSFIILHVIFIVGSDIEARQLHLYVLQVAHAEMNPLLLSWAQHLLQVLDVKHRFGESFLCISQHVHPRPSSPSAQGIVDIIELVSRFDVGGFLHEAIVLHRQFSRLGNILIYMDERVDGIEILRFFHLSHVVLTIFLNHLKGTQTGSTSVAHLIIIGVHLQISLLAVGLETYKME